MTVHSVRINSSGKLRLPYEVLESLQIRFGDELLIRVASLR
jgi:bifunctional DNA-binding transcriptional regulator/antitoxin component of YhaV-PrlF toxin-antitoxin module